MWPRETFRTSIFSRILSMAQRNNSNEDENEKDETQTTTVEAVDFGQPAQTQAAAADSQDRNQPNRNSGSTGISIGPVLRPYDSTEPMLGGTRQRNRNLPDRDSLILTEADVPRELGHAFSSRRRWMIVTVVAILQISMNLNASIFGNSVHDLRTKFEVAPGTLRLCQALFLIAYAFGCELWAPWSEEAGRWKTLQWSLGLVNLWQIPPLLLTMMTPGAVKGNTIGAIILICRILGGLCSAGGSVTLGMIADMWHADEQQYAMAYLVWASVMGSIVGPILGGFLESFASGGWVFAAQLIIGLFAQFLHAVLVPETRSRVIVTREAKRRRKDRGENVFSQYEVTKTTFFSGAFWKYAGAIWLRPFLMFVTEPIVLCLSLISGFSDALIFTFLESLPMVMDLWGLGPWQKGLCFVPIGLGYCIAWAIWAWVIRRWDHKKAKGQVMEPEDRLNWLLWVAPLLPICVFTFAWTGTGPPMHWIVPQVSLLFIGIANYAIYGATVDYMVAAYGEELSASATGGNGFARDFLAGVSALYANSLYSRVGPRGKHLQFGSTILGCIAVPLIVPIYVFFWFGPSVRSKSRFAREVQGKRQAQIAIGDDSSAGESGQPNRLEVV